MRYILLIGLCTFLAVIGSRGVKYTRELPHTRPDCAFLTGGRNLMRYKRSDGVQTTNLPEEDRYCDESEAGGTGSNAWSEKSTTRPGTAYEERCTGRTSSVVTGDLLSGVSVLGNNRSNAAGWCQYSLWNPGNCTKGRYRPYFGILKIRMYKHPKSPNRKDVTSDYSKASDDNCDIQGEADKKVSIVTVNPTSSRPADKNTQTAYPKFCGSNQAHEHGKNWRQICSADSGSSYLNDHETYYNPEYSPNMNRDNLEVSSRKDLDSCSGQTLRHDERPEYHVHNRFRNFHPSRSTFAHDGPQNHQCSSQVPSHHECGYKASDGQDSSAHSGDCNQFRKTLDPCESYCLPNPEPYSKEQSSPCAGDNVCANDESFSTGQNDHDTSSCIRNQDHRVASTGIYQNPTDCYERGILNHNYQKSYSKNYAANGQNDDHIKSWETQYHGKSRDEQGSHNTLQTNHPNVQCWNYPDKQTNSQAPKNSYCNGNQEKLISYQHSKADCVRRFGHQEQDGKEDCVRYNSYVQGHDSSTSHKQASPCFDSHKQDSPISNSYVPDPHNSDSHQQYSSSYDSYKQASPSFNSHKKDSSSLNSYDSDSYSSNSYVPDPHNSNSHQQYSPSYNSHKQASPCFDFHKQDSPISNSYVPDPHNSDSHQQYSSYKQASPCFNSHKKDSSSLNSYDSDSYSCNHRQQHSPSFNSYKQNSPSSHSSIAESPCLKYHKQDSSRFNCEVDDPHSCNHHKQYSSTFNSCKQGSPSFNYCRQHSPCSKSYNQDSSCFNSYKKDSPSYNTYHQDRFNNHANNFRNPCNQ